MASRTSVAHYAWAAGHALVLLTSLHCFMGVITFRPHPYSYKFAYAGATLSWGIVVYKSLPPTSLGRAYIQRALMDENVQYLLLALYWNLAEKPIPLTLIPFATFSLFHTFTFVRSLLPKPPVLKPKKGDQPATASPPPAAGAPGVELNKRLQTLIKQNYEGAMRFVSYYEVIVVMGRLLLGAITFRNSLFTPLLFAQFLRLRYTLSPQTQEAFRYVSTKVDAVTAHPSCPEPIKRGILLVRDLIIRYGSNVLNAQAAGAATNAGRPAPAAQAEAR